MGLTCLIYWLGNRRRTNEERQIRDSALAFRFIRDGNSFYSVELGRKNLNAYGRRIGVNGKTDDAGR